MPSVGVLARAARKEKLAVASREAIADAA